MQLQVDLLSSIEQKKIEFMNLDLEPIIFKLTHNEDGESWGIEKALKYVDEYKCWLFVNWLHGDESLPPSKEIDKVWHTHALDTQLYEVQTKKLFGKFFHHFPYFGVRSEQDKANLDKAFERTKVLMGLYGSSFGCNFSALCGEGCGSSLCGNNACDSNSCGKTTQTFGEEELLAVRPDRFGKTKIRI